jgi:hypothetical protein
MGNELRAVVHSQMGGGWIPPEEFLDGSDHIHRLAPPADTTGQADAAVFIDNIQEFQSAAILCLIELKVDCPHVVRVLGSE